jgi:hypothetical protein
MDNLFKIAFRGEVADGFSLNDVRSNFARRFRKDEEIIDRLFSGASFTLAKDLDFDRANAAAGSLREIGAIVYLVDEHGDYFEVAVPPSVNDSGINEATQPPDEASANEASANEAEVGAVDEPETISAEILSDSEAEAPETDSSAAKPIEESDNTDPYDLTATAKVRHLTQITDKRVIAAQPEVDLKRVRLRYQFDTFMAKGGGSIFKALTAVFVTTFVVIGLLRGVLLWVAPETALQHDAIGFWGNFYITFLEITDPGNMAQDIYSGVGYKVFAVLAGLAGIVMLSALIAFITTAMDQKIYELKRGRSKVIEQDHTLVLGWNEQRIAEILRELVIANESEKDACVVILADKDKEEMDDVLRLRVKDTGTTRVVTRSGDVSSLVNLDMVSLEACNSVIILASCEDTDSDESKASSDAKAIQTVLATMGHDAEGGGVSVIVEIFNPTHREIVRSSFPDHVVTVNTSDILAKLLVQTSRSVGLSLVYNEILSFDGCELYFYDAEWGGNRFGDIGYRFPDGVPLGIRDADGEITMNPDPDRILEPTDEILIVADDDSTIELMDTPVASPSDYELSSRRQEQRVERELMIGWSFKSVAIIREFADYIIDGSEIHVLLKNPTDRQVAQIEALNDELGSIEVALVRKDCLNIEDLMSVEPFRYDNIIILAGNASDDNEVDAGRVDSENIVALLLLRRIFSQYPNESQNTKLITEILDSQNDALVAKAGVKDVIISNRLVSMIIAQVSESRDIEKVYDDIFQEDGSEIYLKPANLYFEGLPAEASFADMMAIAQKRGEICIGVKVTANEYDKAENNGITLIPEKNAVYDLQPNDCFVVLAEDEL